MHGREGGPGKGSTWKYRHLEWQAQHKLGIILVDASSTTKEQLNIITTSASKDDSVDYELQHKLMLLS